MNNYLRLFLSTRGTINRRTFWHGVIVVTALNSALLGGGFWLQTHFENPLHSGAPIKMDGKFQFSELSVLLTIWFSICVFTKRLRSFHASAWAQAPSRILVGWGLFAFSVSTLWSSSPHPVFEMAVALGMVGLLVGLSIDIGLILWMGTANPKHERRLPSE